MPPLCEQDDCPNRRLRETENPFPQRLSHRYASRTTVAGGNNHPEQAGRIIGKRVSGVSNCLGFKLDLPPNCCITAPNEEGGVEGRQFLLMSVES